MFNYPRTITITMSMPWKAPAAADARGKQPEKPSSTKPRADTAATGRHSNTGRTPAVTSTPATADVASDGSHGVV